MTARAQTGRLLLDRIREEFIGLDTSYPTANGGSCPRTYLDSTATTLMMKPAKEVIDRFYAHYGNTHSLLHFGAMISTREYQWAHDRILSFVGADRDAYACFFTGSGTTAGMNRMARVLRAARTDRDTAVVSVMEHHSNDLPHRKQMPRVLHIPLKEHDGVVGSVCCESLERLLEENPGRVNYVALTGVSNVTGIVNPIQKAAELAHHHGAWFIVDGAQLAAHVPIRMTCAENPARSFDALIFSGHKTYVPGSPGVVIARKDILSLIEPVEVGGGMVEDVSVDTFRVKSIFPDREEAGTPNIPGAIGLAAAIEVLDRIGMAVIEEQEETLVRSTVEKLSAIPGVVVYGVTDPTVCRRAASVSFNVRGMDHGLVAAILNDYFNIAVRNECFCAHPYVKEMLQEEILAQVAAAPEREEMILHLQRGMVRASFGLYSREGDVARLAEAVNDIVCRRDYYQRQYDVDSDWNYVHRSFCFDHSHHFSATTCIDKLLG